MSSRMDLLLAGWCTGMYFLRNFLFLSVWLPDPSILIRYWSNWRTSMTMPVSIPFVWMTASLVLDPHSVTYD